MKQLIAMGVDVLPLVRKTLGETRDNELYRMQGKGRTKGKGQWYLIGRNRLVFIGICAKQKNVLVFNRAVE